MLHTEQRQESATMDALMVESQKMDFSQVLAQAQSYHSAHEPKVFLGCISNAGFQVHVLAQIRERLHDQTPLTETKKRQILWQEMQKLQESLRFFLHPEIPRTREYPLHRVFIDVNQEVYVLQGTKPSKKL